MSLGWGFYYNNPYARVKAGREKKKEKTKKSNQCIRHT